MFYKYLCEVYKNHNFTLNDLRPGKTTNRIITEIHLRNFCRNLINHITMKLSTLFTSILLVLTIQCYGQDSWDTWDKRYKEIDYKELIDSEKQYAQNTENNKEMAQYYSRTGRYRITAKFTGKSRPVDTNVFMSMKRVFRLLVGRPEILDELVKNEYLFEVGGSEVWMPIQTQLEEPLKNEIKKGTETTLYCLYLNEHSQKGELYNTFLISEFRKI